MKKTLMLLVIFFFPSQVLGQAQEEIVVSGRAIGGDLPGLVYKRNGDFLLLEITVINDTRDQQLREEEIFLTLENAISLAQADSAIELSLVEEGFVLPLDFDSKITLQWGSRPDTSAVKIRAKTEIDSSVVDPASLLRRLNEFVDSVPVVGRSELIANDDVDVSVVDPSQYRDEIIALIAQDINTITSALGEEYKVIVTGLDRPVEWARTGSIQLSLYIPYSYQIIPDNISSYYDGY